MLTQLPVVRERGVCCALPDVSPAWAENTAELLRALADPTRLTIMASLWKADAPVCICDLTAGLELGQSTISHHMAKLKAAGLVESDKRGIWIHYRVRDRLAPEARRLLEQIIK